MSTARAIELPNAADMGTLANNGIAVLSLQTSLSKTDSSARVIPKLICRMARDDAWRNYIFGHAPDRVYRWNAADFRKFIESPRSEGGCQTPIHVLERMVRDTDAWPVFLKLTRGDSGGTNNPEGRNQWGQVKCDDITLDQTSPVTIPLPEKRKPPTGTSTSYTLRQLERGKKVRGGDPLPPRPDLLAKVKSGEMTPWAAIVEAGYRKPTPNLPKKPAAAVKVIVEHFRGKALMELIQGLTAWAEANQ